MVYGTSKNGLHTQREREREWEIVETDQQTVYRQMHRQLVIILLEDRPREKKL